MIIITETISGKITTFDDKLQALGYAIELAKKDIAFEITYK